jgi:integrase
MPGGVAAAADSGQIAHEDLEQRVAPPEVPGPGDGLEDLVGAHGPVRVVAGELAHGLDEHVVCGHMPHTTLRHMARDNLQGRGRRFASSGRGSTPQVSELYPELHCSGYTSCVPNSISAGLPDAALVLSGPRPIIVRVDRSALRRLGSTELVPGGPSGAELVELFDLEGLPDGHPFVLRDDATTLGTDHLNRYLLAAHRNGAYEPRSLSSFHAPKLTAFLRWLWDHRGEPVEMTATTTADLVAYRDRRLATVSSSSWDTELGCLSSYFRWARDAGLMPHDPIPRWGTRQRNTMRVRLEDRRTPKFLHERELRFFLLAGLRGDRVYGNRPLSFTDDVAQPGFPLRDFAIGFVEVTTGLRREETARLLDVELPSSTAAVLEHPPFAGHDLHRFVRYGKHGKPRWVYVTASVVDVLDRYRSNERRRIVEAAQPRLKEALPDLLIVNATRVRSGKTQLHIGTSWREADRLADSDRARAVTLTAEGAVEPLGLFLTQRGLPPVLNYLNELYVAANERCAAAVHPDRPSIRVSNHTMRHTFAVRTLAALIQESRRTEGAPYALVTNPVFTVQELLGHSDPETTARYLYAAERYEAVPDVLQANAARIAASIDTGGTPHD